MGFMVTAPVFDNTVLHVEARLPLPPEQMEALILWFNTRDWFDAMRFQNTRWKMLVSHFTNGTVYPALNVPSNYIILCVQITSEGSVRQTTVSITVVQLSLIICGIGDDKTTNTTNCIFSPMLCVL